MVYQILSSIVKLYRPSCEDVKTVVYLLIEIVGLFEAVCDRVSAVTSRSPHDRLEWRLVVADVGGLS